MQGTFGKSFIAGKGLDFLYVLDVNQKLVGQVQIARLIQVLEQLLHPVLPLKELWGQLQMGVNGAIRAMKRIRVPDEL